MGLICLSPPESSSPAWITGAATLTTFVYKIVIPAEAGIQVFPTCCLFWIPAFVGMTEGLWMTIVVSGVR